KLVLEDPVARVSPERSSLELVNLVCKVCTAPDGREADGPLPRVEPGSYPRKGPARTAGTADEVELSVDLARYLRTPTGAKLVAPALRNCVEVTEARPEGVQDGGALPGSIGRPVEIGERHSPVHGI